MEVIIIYNRNRQYHIRNTDVREEHIFSVNNKLRVYRGNGWIMLTERRTVAFPKWFSTISTDKKGKERPRIRRKVELEQTI